MRKEKQEQSSKESYEWLEPLLVRGLEWLSRKISDTVDLLSGRSVSLAMIAYCHFDYKKYRNKINILKKKLLSLQKKEDGSWNNELWDTAWAVLALAIERYCTGKKTINFAYPPLRNALAFIEDTKNTRNNWGGELNESILTAFSLLEMNCSEEYPFIMKAIEWIISKQSQEGQWIDIYDTCLAVRLIVKVQDKLNKDFSNSIASALKWLSQWNPENEGVWTNANLLSCYLDAGVGTSKPIVIKLYKWFVENESDGCWSSYEDEQACSLIALSELKRRLPRPPTSKEVTMSAHFPTRVTDLKGRVEMEIKNLGYSVIRSTRIQHSDVEFDLMAEKGVITTDLIVVRIFEKTIEIRDVDRFLKDVKRAKEIESSIEQAWMCGRDFSHDAYRLAKRAEKEEKKLGFKIELRRYG